MRLSRQLEEGRGLLPRASSDETAQASSSRLAAKNTSLDSDAALYLNRYAAMTLAAQVVEPGLKAIATTKVLAGIEKLSQGKSPVGDLVDFVRFGLVLAPLAGFVGQVSQGAWFNHARAHYDQAFLAQELHQPAMWAARHFQADEQGLPRTDAARQDASLGSTGSTVGQQRTTLMASNLCWNPTNEVNAAASVMRSACELGVAMALFGHTMGPEVAVALAFGAILVGVFGQRLVATRIAQGQRAEDSQNALFEHRMRIWDNVTLGNAVNLSRWKKTLVALRTTNDTAQRKQALGQASQKLVAWSASATPLALAYARRLVLAQGQGPAASAELIVQLPKLFEAAGTIVALSAAVQGSFLPARANFMRSLERIQTRPSLALQNHISAQEIFVAHNGAQTTLEDAWPDLMEAAQNKASGRWTITGRNGAGKSMLLPRIKSLLSRDASLLLPADLGTLDFETEAGSTGERDIQALSKVIAQGPRVLLLDEWESHLDDANRALFNEKLEAISQAGVPPERGRVIIEISHQPRIREAARG